MELRSPSAPPKSQAATSSISRAWQRSQRCPNDARKAIATLVEQMELEGNAQATIGIVIEETVMVPSMEPPYDAAARF